MLEAPAGSFDLRLCAATIVMSGGHSSYHIHIMMAALNKRQIEIISRDPTNNAGSATDSRVLVATETNLFGRYLFRFYQSNTNGPFLTKQRDFRPSTFFVNPEEIKSGAA